MSLFKPKEVLNTYTDFDGRKYYDLGYKLILLDVDNTIAVPKKGGCDDSAKEFIYKMKDIGFIVVIFSNNTKKRVKYFIGDMDVEYCYWAFKPWPVMYKLMCNKYHVDTSKAISIGDQLLTDVLGANLSGCYAIYTKPLQSRDTFLTSINRFFERRLWRLWNEKM